MRKGQEQAVFHSDLDAEAAGELIAALFFRACVLECVYSERGPGQDATEATGCASAAGRLLAESGGPGKVGFAWEPHMRAGLEVLYRRLIGLQTFDFFNHSLTIGMTRGTLFTEVGVISM